MIAGSDQRGTIFGVHDVSRRMGVSPWHYFDDVPARRHSAVMRGIEEWKRNPTRYGGTGEWSFVRNAGAVTDYWADGIRRMEREDSRAS